MDAAGSDDVPIRPAATVLIVDERPDVRVLMLERSPRAVFGRSGWVFPGGAVDDADGDERVRLRVHEGDDAEASRRLAVTAGALDYWVAAVRETFEEAGILLAVGADGGIDFGDPAVAARFVRHRHQLNTGSLAFGEMAESEDLSLHGPAEVHYVAHWITPPGQPRRFDTRFFVAAMPQGQTPMHDGRETVAHRWVAPHEALASYRSGEMSIMAPTAAMLERLAAFGSVAEAMESAAGAGAAHDEEVRVRLGPDGAFRVTLAHQSGYADVPTRKEPAMLRWPTADPPRG